MTELADAPGPSFVPYEPTVMSQPMPRVAFPEHGRPFAAVNSQLAPAQRWGAA